ncbi:MAG: hypothetical protein NT133_12730 [Alphaproteobacteria bacterium]|nr:hypothetical protein [Alphaproteobacteria bacterium]
MSLASPTPSHQTGLAAALAVVRLVMAVFDTLFGHFEDLPPAHPDRRLHARVLLELRRTEARLLAEIDAAARIAPPRRRVRAPAKCAPAPAPRRPRWHHVRRRIRPARAPPCSRLCVHQ